MNDQPTNTPSNNSTVSATHNPLNTPPGKPTDLAAIAFAVFFPTLVTLVYFQWLKDSGSSYQQIAYGAGKVLQFGFPVVWVWLWYRGKFRSLSFGQIDKRQLWYGIGFGLFVVASMFSIYFLMIAPTEIATKLIEMVKEKVSGFGVDSFWKYLALGIFYALCHSFMEEYYWRWFVFDYLKKFVSVWTANILSSLGFMAHHVILLAFFFGWESPLTYLFSASIAVGGMFWAWQYQQTGRLRSPWLSHMIVDAGIFALGYFLVKDLFV